MKVFGTVLGLLFLLIQYPLWFGKGGWLEVRNYRSKLEAQLEINETLSKRNDQIKAEVIDLKTGLDEIEGSARSDLGMIKDGEVFFKTVDPAVDD